MVRFTYGDSYHTGLSMALYKVLCDELVDCLYVRQDKTSMPLWISNHGRYNIEVRTICERLVAAKELVDGCVDFLGK